MNSYTWCFLFRPYPLLLITGTRLSFEMFLVGMTRVRDIEHLRFMPLQNGHTLEHLTKQGPNPRMLAFLAGYDKNGKWQPDKTRQALDQLHAENEASRPSSKRKGKTANTQNKRGRQSSQNPDANDKRKRKAPSSEPALPDKSFTVHGLDGIFTSFDTPQDGSCLFHAFKALTGCSESVPLMRSNLVAHIESIQDPDLRVNHMLQFFPTAELQIQDFGNRRFNRMWTIYKTRMLTTEWCGMFEVSRLATMYNKSIVVWQKSSSSTVSFMDKCILPGSEVRASLCNLQTCMKGLILLSPWQRDVVHILYVNGNHFEHTDLPADFIPPHAPGTPPTSKLFFH